MSLKALALLHLPRNSTCNFGATRVQEAAQLFSEKRGVKVARKVARVAHEVAGREPPFDDPDFVRMAVAACRACRDIHGDEDDAIADMVDDLRHADPATWPALAAHFERQAHAQPGAQPGRNQTPDESADPLLVTCWTPAGNPVVVRAESPEHDAKLRADNPSPVPTDEGIQPSRAGGDPQLSQNRGSVRCLDCQHAKPTPHPAILECGEGVDSGNPIGGWWNTDEHICERFSRNRDPPLIHNQTVC